MIPKYARLEHERRWLVDLAALPDLPSFPRRLIEDHYLEGARLRLRAVTGSCGEARVFKLCKKYPSDDPLSGPITNLYLDGVEYDLLSTLPGRSIRKQRHTVIGADLAWSVDVFLDALDGLIMAEIEGASRRAVRVVTPPSWAVQEVTGDPFFSGGKLCGINQRQLLDRLETTTRSGSRI